MRTPSSSADGRGQAGEDRVPWVDYSKGICIILVVMMHTSLNVAARVGDAGFMDYVVAFARPFRMPDFFLLSGLFLSRVIDRDWRSFSDTRVVHFAYFYVLWTLILFAFKLPIGLAKHDYALLTPFAWTWIEPYEALWFIYMLPIFAVVCKAALKVPPLVMLAFAAILESARIHTGWTLVDEFAARYVYFLLGWYGARYFFKWAHFMSSNLNFAFGYVAAWALINAAMVFGTVGLFASLPPEMPASQLPVVSLVLGLAGSLAVITIGCIMSRFNLFDFIRYCGQNSIVVYLSFSLPMAFVRALVLMVPGMSAGWATLIVTASAVAIPLAFHAMIANTSLRFLYERPARFRLARPRVAAVAP